MSKIQQKIRIYFGADVAPGFTLVEFLLAAGIGLAVLAAMTAFFVGSSRLYGVQSDQALLGQEMRMALTQMGYDIRMAGFDPKGTGAFGFTTLGGAVCGPKSIALTLDANGDGELKGDREYAAYRLHEKKYLQRYSTGTQPWQPFTVKSKKIKMTECSFLYRLRNGTEIENPAGRLGEIIAVRITLCGQVQGRLGQEEKKNCLQKWVRVCNSFDF